MDVRSCKKCKRLFNIIPGTRSVYCPACMDALEAKIKEVKEFIRENKNCSIETVCENCDVERGVILQWLREERLQLSDSSAIQLSCDVCGSSIPCGRFCENCKKNMMKNFSESIRKESKDNVQIKKTTHDNRMRFLQS